MRTTRVDTWLPVFSGFYGTIWNTDYDEEMELEYINEEREKRGLAGVTWDDVEWDYHAYQKGVVEGVTDSVGDELVKQGFIKAYKLQKLSSPREYNFANDVIHVSMTVTNANKENIKTYVLRHFRAFEVYLEYHYTSYDGFMSSYSPRRMNWIIDIDEVVTHKHKLGSVLSFILKDMDHIRESDIFEDLSGNGVTLHAANFDKLIPAEK